jgi:hypothetical protein
MGSRAIENLMFHMTKQTIFGESIELSQNSDIQE